MTEKKHYKPKIAPKAEPPESAFTAPLEPPTLAPAAPAPMQGGVQTGPPVLHFKPGAKGHTEQQ